MIADPPLDLIVLCGTSEFFCSVKGFEILLLIDNLNNNFVLLSYSSYWQFDMAYELYWYALFNYRRCPNYCGSTDFMGKCKSVETSPMFIFIYLWSALETSKVQKNVKLPPHVKACLTAPHKELLKNTFNIQNLQ